MLLQLRFRGRKVDRGTNGHKCRFSNVGGLKIHQQNKIENLKKKIFFASQAVVQHHYDDNDLNMSQAIRKIRKRKHVHTLTQGALPLLCAVIYSLLNLFSSPFKNKFIPTLFYPYERIKDFSITSC